MHDRQYRDYKSGVAKKRFEEELQHAKDAAMAKNGYSEEEIEEFRDILYSMQEVDVAGWSRSLQLRGIELPDELKDELFLIVGERRFH